MLGPFSHQQFLQRRAFRRVRLFLNLHLELRDVMVERVQYLLFCRQGTSPEETGQNHRCPYSATESNKAKSGRSAGPPERPLLTDGVL